MAQLIKATITSISETTAELTLESGSVVTWPVDELPDNNGEGDIVQLISGTAQAKEILNELLKEDTE